MDNQGYIIKTTNTADNNLDEISTYISDELWNENNEFDGMCADYIHSLRENSELNHFDQKHK